MSTSLAVPVLKWLRRRLPPEATLPQHVTAVGLTALEYGVVTALRPRLPAPELDTQAAEWLRSVERDGFCVVPQFYSAEACRELVAELERVFAEHPSFVQRRSDLRIFGVESASAALRRFADEPHLLGIAQATLCEPSINAFTLGARLDFTPGNIGSGEGWHRDSFVAQFKAIVYLSDVDEHSGPFQLVTGSEKLPQIAADLVLGRIGFQQNRVSERQVERLVSAQPERLRTFTGAAGTLLLVNTSAIHRGKPIERGVRYALTNYYFPRRKIGPALDAHFAPVLRAPAR